MNIHEMMKFVESEYIVINNTPCSICGGTYITEGTSLDFGDGNPSNLTHCFCQNCGHKTIFQFRSPLFGINLKDKLN